MLSFNDEILLFMLLIGYIDNQHKLGTFTMIFPGQILLAMK